MVDQPAADPVASFQADLLKHLDALYNLAVWMTRDPALAEDTVQEACLRAVRFRHQFQPGTNLRAWLFQIVRSVAITQYRRDHRAGRRVGVEALEDQRGGQASGAVSNRLAGGEPFTRVDIDAALEQLPEEYRSVVVLFDLEGLSMADVAAAMSCPVGTVKSRLFRARALLRKSLAEYRRPGA
jgi:RNA polymerase sigma-70 factor (ECF subfamily)